MFELPRLNQFQEQFVKDKSKMRELSLWLEENSYYAVLRKVNSGKNTDEQRKEAKERHEEFKVKFEEYMKHFNDAVEAYTAHVNKQNEEAAKIRQQKSEFTEEVSKVAAEEAYRIVSMASDTLKSSPFYDQWKDHVIRKVSSALHLPI